MNLEPSMPGGLNFGNMTSHLHAGHSPNRDGAVADYIPELGLADPDRFSTAVATVNGHLPAFTDLADDLGLHASDGSNVGSGFVRSFVR